MSTPVLLSGKGPSGRSLLQRVWRRIKYGLLLQEVFDRFARAGIVIYPYLVASESVDDRAAAPDGKGFTLRLLTLGDIGDMVAMRGERVTESRLRALLARAICLGAFRDGQLAGYTWARFDALPIVFTRGHPLFALGPADAYLFDMFVATPYRGHRLAGVLRRALQREVGSRGRTNIYSITVAFNRSSRRFKSRLGARDVEMRLYLHLMPTRLPGCDLRVWRREPRPPTRRFVRVPPRAKRVD